MYMKEALSKIYYWYALATGTKNSKFISTMCIQENIANNKSKLVHATELTFSTLSSFLTCNPTYHSAVLLPMWAAISQAILI